jgi:hypothetical protein
MLSRPELIFWIAALGLALLIAHRDKIVTVVWRAAVVGLPWYGFATWYYGSPIPNTIVAKSWSFRMRFLSVDGDQIWSYLFGSWRHIAPFRQYWAVTEAPIPDSALLAVVLVVLAVALIGLAATALRVPRLLTVALCLALFVTYKTGSVIDRYYMWYLPPFMAVLFVFVAAGLAALARASRPVATAIAAVITFAYVLPLPFAMELDRRTYDYPGLGSRRVVATIRDMPHPSLEAILAALKPDFAMLRPKELADLRSGFPAAAAQYDTVDEIAAAPGLNLRFLGLAHLTVDDRFIILKRRP